MIFGASGSHSAFLSHCFRKINLTMICRGSQYKTCRLLVFDQGNLIKIQSFSWAIPQKVLIQ